MTNVADTDATAISDERLAEMKPRLVEQIRLLKARLSRSAIPEDGWEYSGALADAELKLSLITELQERRRNTLPTSVTDAARDWINDAPHAEECFTNDPNPDACRCICGKESMLARLDEAALPPSRDDAVGVKPLVWEVVTPNVHDAVGVGILYRVRLNTGTGEWRMAVNGKLNDQGFATLSAAKAAAEADHKQRILSALEPAQQQIDRAGPYGWLIVDPALDEEARQLSSDPADENEVKDGCQSFALYLTDEDETRLRALTDKEPTNV